MYNDGVHYILCWHKQHKYVINKLETPGRQITTNCFVQAYFEFEHMYAQHMSDISFLWLSRGGSIILILPFPEVMLQNLDNF